MLVIQCAIQYYTQIEILLFVGKNINNDCKVVRCDNIVLCNYSSLLFNIILTWSNSTRHVLIYKAVSVPRHIPRLAINNKRFTWQPIILRHVHKYILPEKYPSARNSFFLYDDF